MKPILESDVLYGKELGRGGQGVVYELGTDRVYKKYSIDPQHRPSSAALLELVGWPKTLSANERSLVDRECAWPTSVVADRRGEPVGVVMTRIPTVFYVDLKIRGKTIRRPRELQYLLAQKKARDTGIETPAVAERLALCRSWVELFAVFESHDIVFGDISMKNLLWCSRPDPRVFLIDCDTAQTGKFHAPSPWTMGWEDPYLEPDAPADIYSDRYKMALVLYRTLIPSPRQLPGEDPAEARTVLPNAASTDAIVDLVARSADSVRSERPSPAEWSAALEAVEIGPADQLPPTTTTSSGRKRKFLNVQPRSDGRAGEVPPPPRQEDRTRGHTADKPSEKWAEKAWSGVNAKTVAIILVIVLVMLLLLL